MGFLSAFGIDWKILAFQLINFGIIYFLFAKFVWPIILKALDKRQQEIATGLSNAELAKKNLALANIKQQEIISQAKYEAKELINATHQQNKVVHANFLAKMNQEKEELLAAANVQAELEKKQIISQAQKELGLALTSSLESFLDRDLTKAQKENLNSNFIKVIKK